MLLSLASKLLVYFGYTVGLPEFQSIAIFFILSLFQKVNREQTDFVFGRSRDLILQQIFIKNRFSAIIQLIAIRANLSTGLKNCIIPLSFVSKQMNALIKQAF